MNSFLNENSLYLLTLSRTRDLTFDSVRIGKIHTPVFASRREARGFESRNRIGWIVIRDAVAVVIQARLVAMKERQPPFAGGKKAFLVPSVSSQDVFDTISRNAAHR